MNRTVIIVKDKTRSRPVYRAIRLHSEYGQPVEDWLNKDYGTTCKAGLLVWRGHRSTIAEPYPHREHEEFRTLRDAKAWCEYLTLAYHDGKRWCFEHETQGA
jgi:hypothetical protein